MVAYFIITVFFIYFTFLKQFVTVYNSSTIRMSKLDYFYDMYCMTEKQTNTVMNPKGI